MCEHQDIEWKTMIADKNHSSIPVGVEVLR